MSKGLIDFNGRLLYSQDKLGFKINDLDGNF